MKKLLNIYIKVPLLWDLVITAFICFIYFLIEAKFSNVFSIDKELLKSIFSDLISTSISLAGFVLASLTIIVTFKDNLSHKNITESESGIELLLSSKHYGRIVGVFAWAVIIFLILFLLISISKLFVDKIPSGIYIYYSIIPIIIITLTIFRSILVLYKIIKLQLKK